MRCALALPLLLSVALAGGCDRRIEAYDPDEKVEAPDLSRIFPAGAERAVGKQKQLRDRVLAFRQRRKLFTFSDIFPVTRLCTAPLAFIGSPFRCWFPAGPFSPRWPTL